MAQAPVVRRGAICYLRKVIPEDAAVFHEWYCNGEIQKHLANPWWNPAIDFDTYRQYRFAQYLEPNASGGVLVICANAGPTIGLVNYFEVDEVNCLCEVGIIIGEVELWRRGYALESLRLLIDFLTANLGIKTVRARILRENVASQHLFTKVGFVQTGVSREQDFDFLDYHYYVLSQPS